MSKPTQTDQILKHLQEIGPITALDALDYYGCFRLAARINDIQNLGIKVEARRVKTPKGAVIAEYRIKQPPVQLPLFES